jgi:DNA repair protein RadD
MAVITLRPYQDKTVGRLRHAISLGYKSPLLVSPTGSGKTRMFAWLVARLQRSGKRTVVLDHRDELTEQISAALTDAGAQHGLIVAGASYYDPRVTSHVASVFSLNRRLAHTAVPDYVIIDEAHHAIEGSTWGKVIAYWRERNPELVVIGVTATPERLDGSGLGSMFDCMVMAPTTAELIADGWLSPYALFSPPEQVDMTGVTKKDWEREAEDRAKKPRITGSAVEHYRRSLNGAPAVAFCHSIEHAATVAEAFNAQGFRAASIDGKMDKTLRRDVIRDFGAWRLNVLTSCDLISEGFDVPGIVGAILLRPTQSLGLYLQQVGRALRPMYDGGKAPDDRIARLKAIAFGPKPRAVIIDHVGNSGKMVGGDFVVNHGLPDDEREWSLKGRDKKAKADRDPDDMPVKRCPHCYQTDKQYATRCTNPACGEPYVVKSRVVKEEEGELQEVDLEAQRAAQRATQAAAKTAEELKAKLGYSDGRANHIVQARAEKEALRAEAIDASADCYRACGGNRITAGVIRGMKPKMLRELIAACREQIHEQALWMDQQRRAA